MAKVNEKLVENLKSYLQKEKGRLEKEVAEMRDFPDFGSTEDENAMKVTTFQNRLGLVKNLDKVLAQVNAALSKIDEGSYGICEDCGKQIEHERLEISPETKYCASCAGKHTER